MARLSGSDHVDRSAYAPSRQIRPLHAVVPLVMAVEVHWFTVVFTTMFESHPPSSASIRATGPSGRFAVGLEATSHHNTAGTLALPEARSLAVGRAGNVAILHKHGLAEIMARVTSMGVRH